MRHDEWAASLAAGRRKFDALMKSAKAPDEGPGHLSEITAFGSNPAGLRLMAHVPRGLAPGAPLVVALHGCTQSAVSFDRGAGWSGLADQHGFALLLPQQTTANNPKACFSWFLPHATRRGEGEVASIRQMVETLVERHAIDRRRIFVTGLSAGGAMTASLLAAYPDVFAGGAVIAGLPHGTARNVQEAFESMFQVRSRSAGDWAELVRGASSHRGPWPRLSVWHGTADATVQFGNAGELIKQWTALHGLPEAPAVSERLQGHRRDVWLAGDGTELIERFTIEGMAHGLPLAIAGVDDPHGEAGPFMLDVGIASSRSIAAFFGLAGPAVARATEWRGSVPALHDGMVDEVLTVRDEPAAPEPTRAWHPHPKGGLRDVGAIIHNALRSAGLMR
jgi:poly(hydroxyalkanoate) depolymerase family esterase